MTTIANKQFKDIKVSTKTILALVNAELDLYQIYSSLPITEYIIIKKKRGRKKGEPCVDPNKDLKPSSIISIKYKKRLRGINLKHKKGQTYCYCGRECTCNFKNGSNQYFLNSVSIVILLESKLLNIKLFKNGKFQITGCKYEQHAVEGVTYLWEHIQRIQRMSWQQH